MHISNRNSKQTHTDLYHITPLASDITAMLIHAGAHTEPQPIEKPGAIIIGQARASHKVLVSQRVQLTRAKCAL